MNSIGFMEKEVIMAIRNKKYEVNFESTRRWDRQTIVIMCDNKDTIEEIRNNINKSRKPNVGHCCENYRIDGFVNLVYDPREIDPANRNVRIVYCDMSHMRSAEVYERFQCSYIIRVERSEQSGARQISRRIPKISGK